MAEHAKYSPSAASRWIKCPGSIDLEAKFPDTEGHAAARGTVIHAMAAWALSPDSADPLAFFPGKHWLVFYPDCPSEMAGLPITQDMIDVTAGYVRFIERMREELLGANVAGAFLIEHRLYDSPKLFGTVDALLIFEKTMRVVDLKTGRNAVSPERNSQLMTYAGIALQDFTKVERVELIIYQDGEAKAWETDARAIRQHMAKVYAAMKDDYLAAGEHCEWCKAAAICPEVNALVAAPRTPPAEMGDYTPEQYAELLGQMTAIRKWLDEAKGHVLNLMQQGVEIPGYKRIEKVSNVKWHDEDAARATLVSHFPGKKVLNPGALRTPTQLKKELGEEAVEVIDALAGRHVTGEDVVKESHKSPALPSPVALMDQVDGSYFDHNTVRRAVRNNDPATGE